MSDARRCDWCAVRLRWWQFEHCRMCRRALAFDSPGPPCPYRSRSHALPDTLTTRGDDR